MNLAWKRVVRPLGPALGVALLFAVRTIPAVSLTQCSCWENGAGLEIPEDIAARVADVRASGVGCSTGVVKCLVSSDPGCTWFQVTATAEGPCHIEVEFDDEEVFARDVTFEETSGCQCDGLYPVGDYSFAVTKGG